MKYGNISTPDCLKSLLRCYRLRSLNPGISRRALQPFQSSTTPNYRYSLLSLTSTSKRASAMRRRRQRCKIDKHIYSTISRGNLRFVYKCETLYQALTALKKRLAPSDRAEKPELIRQYQTLCKAPQNHELDSWIDR